MDGFASVKQYYTYPQYLQLIEQLVAEGKTTGYEPTESRISYTQLNLQRMNRWNKTFVVDDTLVQTIAAALPQT